MSIRNPDLIIKTRIWKKETFELIDYLDDDTIDRKIPINSSGVLRKIGKKILFFEGENLSETDEDLLKIEKNPKNGKYIVNCGNWSKDLNKLVDETGAFLVYKGLSLRELYKSHYRYYKLTQGDIFKIGRIYFKVLDIQLNRESSEEKINNENTIKGTMIKSLSCNSILINGQQVIKGAFCPHNSKKNMDKLFSSRCDNFNNKNNNSILNI